MRMSATNGGMPKATMTGLGRERSRDVARFMLDMISDRTAQEAAEAALASCILFTWKHREQFMDEVHNANPESGGLCEHERSKLATVLDTLAVSFS